MPPAVFRLFFCSHLSLNVNPLRVYIPVIPLSRLQRVKHNLVMENVKRINAAVSSIKKELKILAQVSESLNVELSDPQQFLNRLINEFNTKLRSFKSKNIMLTEENEKLKQRVSILEAALADAREGSSPEVESLRKAQKRNADDVTEPSIKLNTLTQMRPPKRRSSSRNRDSPIFSSPIRVSDDPEADIVASRSPTKKGPPKELTSSQFNMLPTQYSDASSLPTKDYSKSRKRDASPDLSSSHEERGPDNAADCIVANSPDDVIVDSQDEVEPLDCTGNSPSQTLYPKHYTALQRADFLRTYYRLKLQDKSFVCDMTLNPITEMAWTLDDFVPNPNWRPKKLNSNLGVMTKQQETLYGNFFKEAGYGVKPAGPKWTDSCQLQDQEADDEWVRSQVMDKYLSPPRYMVGDFMSTQEAKESKALVKQKEAERIRRRLQSALKGEEFMFFEEVFNSIVLAGRDRKLKIKF